MVNDNSDTTSPEPGRADEAETFDEVLAPEVPKLNLLVIPALEPTTAHADGEAQQKEYLGKASKHARSASQAPVGSVSRRARSTLSLPHEVRTDADLAVLDDIMWGAEASAYLTRGARLRVARACSLTAFEHGDSIAMAGTSMDTVYFIVSGEVVCEAPWQARPHTAPVWASSPGAPPHAHSAAPGQQAGSKVVLRAGQSLGSLYTPTPTLDTHTPRTRQWGTLPAFPRWDVNAWARGSVECAAISQAAWAAIAAQHQHWDAREVAAFLEDVTLFGALSSAQLLQLGRQVREVEVAPGALVFRQGSDSTDAYVVRSGHVRLLRELRVSGEVTGRMNELTNTMAHIKGQLERLCTPPARWQPPGNQQRSLSPRMMRLYGLSSPDGSFHPGGASTHRPWLQSAGEAGAGPDFGGDHSPTRNRNSHFDQLHNAQGTAPRPLASAEAPRGRPVPHQLPLRPATVHGGFRGRVPTPVIREHAPLHAQGAPHAVAHTPLGAPRQSAHESSCTAPGRRPASRARRRTSSSAASALANDTAGSLLAVLHGPPARRGHPSDSGGARSLACGPAPRGAWGDSSGARPPAKLPAATRLMGAAPLSIDCCERAHEALGEGVDYPFTHHTPRTLSAAEGVVYVDVGLLGAGRVFGEGTSVKPGERRAKRDISAVADTAAMLLVLQRAEIESKLGSMVSFLWSSPEEEEGVQGLFRPPTASSARLAPPPPGRRGGCAGRGGGILRGPRARTADAAMYAQLERSMNWEIYKKRLMADVFTEKASRAAMGPRHSFR